jgi:hypothetical protein
VEHLDHLPDPRVGTLVAVHGWFVYLRMPISESEIMREIEREAGPRR